MALNVSAKAQKRINEFADWIMSYFPSVIKVEPIKTALKGFTKSYQVNIIETDPLMQLNNTKKAVTDKLQADLIKMKGLKVVLTLKIFFEKLNKDKVLYIKMLLIVKQL